MIRACGHWLASATSGVELVERVALEQPQRPRRLLPNEGPQPGQVVTLADDGPEAGGEGGAERLDLLQPVQVVEQGAGVRLRTTCAQDAVRRSRLAEQPRSKGGGVPLECGVGGTRVASM